jgi:hypothetical protein
VDLDCGAINARMLERLARASERAIEDLYRCSQSDLLIVGLEELDEASEGPAEGVELLPLGRRSDWKRELSSGRLLDRTFRIGDGQPEDGVERLNAAPVELRVSAAGELC